MTDAKPLKISYCTTCKGRLHHLKQTLPANMAAERNNPNVEFVVLDYGSEDGLADWIKQNFQAEMDSGRLRYARYEAPQFKMAHAKNMAHRLATGDVLCNVDADNFIAKDFSVFLNDSHSSGHNFVSTLDLTSKDLHVRAAKIIFGYPVEESGIRGRISIDKGLFNSVKGYDESVKGARLEDFNLGIRCKFAGASLARISSKYWGKAINHSDAERVKYFSKEHKDYANDKLDKGLLVKYRAGLKAVNGEMYDDLVNPHGQVGCGTVHINFSSTPTLIEPLAVGQSKPIARQQATADEIVLARRTDWAADVTRAPETTTTPQRR